MICRIGAAFAQSGRFGLSSIELFFR